MAPPRTNRPAGCKKLTQQERDFIMNDKATSKKLLAMQFGVNDRLIDFIQNPDKYAANNAYMSEYRQKRREVMKTKARKPRPKKVKPVPLNPYAQKIHDAVQQGVGVWDIDAKLNRTLSQLVQNRTEIDKQIEEVRLTQNALYDYVDIKPLVLDPSVELRNEDKPVHMTDKDMRWYMVECGLSSKKLVEVMGKKYSVRAIDSYRQGQVPVPRDVAELLRGYPRKEYVLRV